MIYRNIKQERGGKTMAEKKVEAKAPVEQEMVKMKEDSGAPALLVETVWDQYEQSLTKGREMWENQEDAFINAMREVIKFNKQYRKSLTGLYRQTKKTNNEIFNEVIDNLPLGKEEIANEAILDGPLSDQLKEVAGQIEKLALTPVKFAFEFIEKLEENMEKDTENYVSFARERRNAWQKVTDEYVSSARVTSNKVIERSLDGLKELVGSK